MADIIKVDFRDKSKPHDCINVITLHPEDNTTIVSNMLIDILLTLSEIDATYSSIKNKTKCDLYNINQIKNIINKLDDLIDIFKTTL